MDDDPRGLDAMRALALWLADTRGQFTASDITAEIINHYVARSGSNVVPADLMPLAFRAIDSLVDEIDSLVDEGALTRYTPPGAQHVYQRPASGN